MDNDINVKKKYSIQVILSIALLLILTGGFTYAFFNYTRTGNSNILRLGEIVFHYSEGNNISLSNVFPIKVERDSNGNITNQEGIGEVEILIDGRTTYSEGIEYIVRAVNVNNGTTKKLPIGIDIKVETNGEGNNDNLGIEDSDYFQNRGSYTTSHYNKLLNSDALTEESDILVGFIAGNNNNTNNSVNGKIIIKAYIDDSKILVSDTYDGTESDNMGTSSSMAEGKTVFTTSEWNALQTSGVSFQIKVEANEGIWVEHGTNNVTDPRLFVVRLLDNGTYEITGFAKESSSETSSETSGETSSETSSETSGETSGEESAGVANNIVIPSEIDGIRVTAIGEWAFSEKQLTSVVIPNSVTYIGNHAFAYNQLTSVEIPNSVTTIGIDAFSENQLTNVVIPNSVTTIGNDVFSENQLTSVEIPDSVTTIGMDAFANNQLTSVEIPNSVTTIGDRAFSENQLTSVEIPNSVTTIGYYAFSENQLTSVEISNSVRRIGEYVFYNNQLTSVEIPNSVTYIGNYAFASNQLTSVEIPDSVTAIDWAAFNDNKLPNSQAFIYARKDDNNDGIAEIDTSTIVSYGGLNKEVTIPNNVTTIGEYAFSENQLTSVVIPNSVVEIGLGAFSENQLTSVEIPNSVVEIEYGAFSDNQLTSVEIPNSVTTIGDSAFSSNTGIVLTFNNRTCSTVKGLYYYSWGASSVYGTDGVCN